MASRSPEESKRAGHLGSEATTATHGHEFYEKIGRIGGEAKAAALHHEAASHHEAAAHHHRQAAYHYSRGEKEQARQHAEHAYAHSQNAHALHEAARRQFGGISTTRDSF